MPTQYKPIRERVEEGFASSEMLEFGKDYIGWLLENYREVEKSVRRTAFIIVTLITLFELISRAAITELSLGLVTLRDLTLIQRVLPAVVGYFFFEWTSYMVEVDWLRTVYYEIFRKVYRPLHNAHLETPLVPQTPHLYMGARVLVGRNRTIDLGLGAVLLIVMIGGVPVFEIAAYYRLFNRFGYTNLLVWSSMAVALIFVARAINMWISDFQRGEREVQ